MAFPLDHHEFRDLRAAREELKRVVLLPRIEPDDLNRLWRELFGAEWPAEKPDPNAPTITINL